MSSPRLSIKLRHSLANIPLTVAVAVLLPTLGIALSEGLLSLGFVSEGLWGYIVTLLMCTITPVYFRDTTPIFAAFALLPVFRLVNLTMPVFVELTLYWIVFVYAPFVIAGGYFLIRSEVVAVDLNVRGTILWAPVALVGGLTLAELAYRFDRAPFLLPETTTSGLGLLVGAVLLGALVEEVLFRGILQATLRDQLGPVLAVVVTSVVFAIMQIPFGGSAAGIAFVASVGYGISFERSESILIPVLFHGTTNVVLFTFFPVYGSLLSSVQ